MKMLSIKETVITQEERRYLSKFDDEILDLIETQLRNDDDSLTQSDLQGAISAIVLDIVRTAYALRARGK